MSSSSATRAISSEKIQSSIDGSRDRLSFITPYSIFAQKGRTHYPDDVSPDDWI